MSEPTQISDSSSMATDELVKTGQDLLMRQVRPVDAARAFATALQAAPNLSSAHFGMAQANFSLGMIPVARSAAEYVIHLNTSAQEVELSKIMLLCFDRTYDDALQRVTEYLRDDMGNAYAHALRGYIFRNLRQEYDASLEEAKASRLASTADLRPLFPRLDPVVSDISSVNSPATAAMRSPQPPVAMRRQMVRASIALQNYPVVTLSIIAISTIVYILEGILSGGNLLSIDPGNAIAYNGLLAGIFVQQGQWWRLVTTIFVESSLIQLAFSIFSLWMVGSLLERIYGPWRFALIFLGSGIGGGLIFMLFASGFISVIGSFAAVAGIFGAMGAFFLAHRDRLGPAANGFLQQWIILLAINVMLNFSAGILASYGIGGLVVGFVLGLILSPLR